MRVFSTHVSEGTFEIDDYQSNSYMYECVAPLRAIMLQKTAPTKFKKVSFFLSCNYVKRVLKMGQLNSSFLVTS